MYFRSYEDNEDTDMNGNTSYFSNPSNLKNILKNDIKNRNKLDNNGIVKEGVYVDDNDIIISKSIKRNISNNPVIDNISGKSINFMTSGIVDKVIITKNKENLRKCKVRIFKEKIPDIGDKYASRCGQKGMCGLLLEQHQMPFTKDGIVPDIIINPHAIPTRMTINQL